MRIGVVEWDISILGGRQKTMLAFADYFAELGHDVTFFSAFRHPQPEHDYTAETWRAWHALEFKGVAFDFDCELKRPRFYRGGVPAAWRSMDMMMFPYGNYGELAPGMPNTLTVCWNIHPDQGAFDGVHETWTNSESVRGMLIASGKYAGREGRLHVVIPPHAYGHFRRAAWQGRRYDACTVGQLIETKGLIEFHRFCARRQLRGVICATGNVRPDENRRVLDTLIAEGAHVRLCSTSYAMADIFGQSKCFLTFSHVESCSIAVYEAMNAGCWPVVRDTSWAAKEQLGDVGDVFSTDDEAAEAICRRPCDTDAAISRGRRFDRDAVGRRVAARLEAMCAAG